MSRDLLATVIAPGNVLLSYRTGRPVKVDWLVIKHLESGNFQSILTPDVPVYVSIPLTVDILQTTNFQLVHNDCWQMPNGFWIWHNVKDDSVLREGFYWGEGYHQIHTLHELQNLVMVLGSYPVEINIEKLIAAIC